MNGDGYITWVSEKIVVPNLKKPLLITLTILHK